MGSYRYCCHSPILAKRDVKPNPRYHKVLKRVGYAVGKVSVQRNRQYYISEFAHDSANLQKKRTGKKSGPLEGQLTLFISCSECPGQYELKSACIEGFTGLFRSCIQMTGGGVFIKIVGTFFSKG